MATFKELCLDTSVAGTTIGEFYAAALGLRAERFADGDPAEVVGDEEGQGIAICPVPDAKTAKNRVHPDVAVGSVDDLVAHGATVTATPEELGRSWTLMADPEGNELCAFVRDPVPDYRLLELIVDAADPESITRWWADRFGVPARNDGQPWWYLEEVPGMSFDSWVFQPVPEPKTVKNRWHWDLYGTPEEFLDHGARLLWEVPGRTRPVAWTVLGDPEGNEFCVFPQ